MKKKLLVGLATGERRASLGIIRILILLTVLFSSSQVFGKTFIEYNNLNPSISFTPYDVAAMTATGSNVANLFNQVACNLPGAGATCEQTESATGLQKLPVCWPSRSTPRH